MSKAVYAGLFAVALALLALTTACGSTDKDKGGCGAGCACGGGCGDACGCGCACACGDGCGEGESDTEHASRLMKAYKGYTKTNATAFKSKAHKAMVHNWVNQAGLEAFQSGKGNYPVGSVIAKEGWKKNKLATVFLMEKRAKGYDADGGDWWYGTVTAKGKVKNAGKVSSCAGCHVDAGNDYVYGNPK